MSLARPKSVQSYHNTFRWELDIFFGARNNMPFSLCLKFTIIPLSEFILKYLYIPTITSYTYNNWAEKERESAIILDQNLGIHYFLHES